MNNVTVSAIALGIEPDAALDRLRDFTKYPELAEAVVSVDVDEASEVTMVSTWVVKFRRGLMHWTERDVLDTATRTIKFEQITGDFTDFHGTWQITRTSKGAQITFAAEFDLGIPSLGDLLNPLAEAALRANIVSILSGLFADIEQVDTADVA